RNPRLSGSLSEPALAWGVVSMGADVMLCGPLPTPGIAFITSSMRADAGVVISASHNPYHDNGLKIFARDGFKLPDEVELEIEQMMLGKELESMRSGPADIGKAVRIEDAVGRYVVYLKATFPRDRTLDGVKLGAHRGNGAAHRVGPEVLPEAGRKVIRAGVHPNGKNINDGAGGPPPEKMGDMVRREHADLGIALDGDADRVIV